jgi:hypothetical protein
LRNSAGISRHFPQTHHQALPERVLLPERTVNRIVGNRPVEAETLAIAYAAALAQRAGIGLAAAATNASAGQYRPVQRRNTGENNGYHRHTQHHLFHFHGYCFLLFSNTTAIIYWAEAASVLKLAGNSENKNIGSVLAQKNWIE